MRAPALHPHLRRGGLALTLIVAACVGQDAFDPDKPPPSRRIAPDTETALPQFPPGTIPRHLLYSQHDWRGVELLAKGSWSMSIDHRDVPRWPPWRLTAKQHGDDFATAHLDSALRLKWLVERWRRLRRDGDRLIGVEWPFSELDSVKAQLPPGEPLFTDLSLMFLLSIWPLERGWEHRGVMTRDLVPVPVRLRVVGEERIPTRMGTIDCWIVAVGPVARRRLEPVWYWVAKEQPIVVMRRRYLRWSRGAIEERRLEGWAPPHSPTILIDAVVAAPPRVDAAAYIGLLNAIEMDFYRAGYRSSVRGGDETDTLMRLSVTTEPYRPLTAVDSAEIARLLAARRDVRASRVESPSDRTYQKVPRRAPR